MKQKIWKAKFLIFFSIFFSFSVFNGFSREKNPFSFTVSPFYQLKNGCMNEFVYLPNSNDNDNPYKLSELNWNLYNISYMGADFSISNGWLRIETGFLSAFPKRSGFMYDSDWYGVLEEPVKEYKTTFSISENTLRYNIGFNNKISISKDFSKCIVVGAFTKYNFDLIKFSARNGYGLYGGNGYSVSGENVPYEDPSAKFFGIDSLLGIDYLRHTQSIFIGALFGFDFGGHFKIKSEISVSPFTYFQSIDHHYSSSFYYDVILSYFDLFNFSIDGSIFVSKKLSFGVSIAYTTFMKEFGKTYFRSSNDDTLIASKSYGISPSEMSASSGEWCDFKFYLSYTF